MPSIKHIITPFITIVLFLLLSSVLSHSATPRHALVIGNSNYKVSPLRNPVNDANDIAEVLKGSGFKVELLTNANQRQIESSIKKLGKTLKGGGVGLFYFAGHGVQMDRINYLIPVDAEIETEADVKYEAVDANRVMSQMQEAGNEVNLVFLDACRNNPYERSFSRSAQQGLAQMDSPVGSLVAFATAPGSVAADGNGRNGVYTKHLIKAIERSGLEIGMLMRSVRTNVRKETSGKQVPFELSSLEGAFYFGEKEISQVNEQKSNKEKESTEISALTDKTKFGALSKDQKDNSADSLFYKGDYQRALPIYKEIVYNNKNPDSTATAWFMMGECFFKIGKYDQAILQYQKIISKNSSHSKAPSALLRQAEAFEQLKDAETAKLIYRKLISSYRYTPEAGKAKSRLDSI